MKTNQVMTRKLAEFEILQRTKDGMFNATLLLKQWNEQSTSNRKMDNYFSRMHTKMLIHSLKNETEAIPFAKSRDSRGSNKGTWMSPLLFLDFIEYLSIDLYIKAKILFTEENLITREAKVEVLRDEIIHLRNVYDAIKVSCENTFVMMQYPCCDNKYKLDLIVWHDHEYSCEDDETVTNRNITIIEYDEEYHKRISESDRKREKDITKFLVQETEKEGKIPNIEIIRIKRGQEPYMYAYVIPYITNLETSYSLDKIYELLDMRILYEGE